MATASLVRSTRKWSSTRPDAYGRPFILSRAVCFIQREPHCMQLYGYFRSSAAYRVRIVANLKGLELDQLPVNLVKGEQRTNANLARNPQGLVPTLVTDEGHALNQSLA